MPNLTEFVSSNEIRAVLGVTAEELEDAQLALPIYLRQLQFFLEDIDSDIESTYLSTAALSSRTTDQQKFYDVVQTFSAYAISRVLLTSMSLFSPRRITDGRSEVERVVDPFQDVRDGVNAGFQTMTERLKNAYNTLGNNLTVSAAVFPYSVAAGLAVDPVTNT